MALDIHDVKAEPLTAESFAPFGYVMGPKDEGRIDNVDFLKLGVANLSDAVPESRYQDWNVLQYWGDVTELTPEPLRLGYLRPKQRDLEYSWFERHVKGTQSFIPLGGGRSVFSIAPASDNDDPEALPDLTKVRAFHLDGTVGVTIKPGVWHWTPFPVGGPADFLILVRQNVANDDLNFVDLEARLNARVRIAL